MAKQIASKEKRTADIALMLEQGLERKEILQRLSKTCKVSARTLDNEIKQAKLIVSKRNEDKEAIRQATMSKEYKDALNEAIINDIELEAILCTIARGNIQVEEFIRGEAILRSVTPMEQISAIDKLYKKRGSNAPTKQDITSKGEEIKQWNVVITDGSKNQ
jgi:hypothetical protein